MSGGGRTDAQGAALVTGGARRIGAAICRRLAAAGYDVVIHCNTSRGAAQALAAALQAEGARVAMVQGDLRETAGLAALMERAALPFGAPRLLVNNASVFHEDRAGDATPEGFAANLAVNLVAPVLLAQHFARLLQEASGAIVNLIDQRVLRPDPRFFTYTLAKSAMFCATKTLAQALAPRIRVNAVGPGPTLPNIHEGGAAFAREAAGTLLGAAISPEEIAAAVLFLAQSPRITGQMIAVDSGQHLGWKTPDVTE